MTQKAPLFLFFILPTKIEITFIQWSSILNTPYYTFLNVIFTIFDGCYYLFLELCIKSKQYYGDTNSNVQDSEFFLSNLQFTEDIFSKAKSRGVKILFTLTAYRLFVLLIVFNL